MPFLNPNEAPHLRVWDGIHGPIFHSDTMTLACLILEEGAVAAPHQHPHEQWTHVIDGELEFTLDGETKVLYPGMIAHIPPNVLHGAMARKKTFVIDCFRPVREDFKALPEWVK